MHAIAETIGAGLGVPVRRIADKEAESHFGWLTRFVSMDQPISSALTRDRMRWSPREKGLLTDMAESGYLEMTSGSKL